MIYIALTIGLFIFFASISKKTKIALINPVLLSIISIVIILKLTKTGYETYMEGGIFITYFLYPGTVALGIPLYRNWVIIKTRGLSLILGILIGTITAIFSVLFLSKIFGLNKEIFLSLLPKSITTPIGQEVSKTIGGIPSLTVSFIVITGILGNMIGPVILRILNISDPVAMGAALGTASHAIGTAKALELGEIQGAVSSVALSISGLLSAILIPLIILFW